MLQIYYRLSFLQVLELERTDNEGNNFSIFTWPSPGRVFRPPGDKATAGACRPDARVLKYRDQL